jgi:hypothetical protein
VAIFGFEHGASRRYAELATRLFGVEGADAPLPPGILLEVDRPEWAAIKGETLWSAEVTVAAVAAVAGFAQIFNPAGSGIIAVIRSIIALEAAGAADRYTLGLIANTIGAPGGIIAADDTRLPLAASTGGTPLVINAGTSAALPVGGRIAAVIAVPVGADARYGLPLIISPGFGVWIQGVNLNTQQIYSFEGYYRRALPEELKF